MNIVHWVVSSIGSGGATLAEIAEALSSVWHTHYKALSGTTATFRGVGVSNIWPLPATIEYVYTGDTGAGVATGEPLPKQVSGLISLLSPLAGPRNRGRIYPPFPTEGLNDAVGAPNATAILALADLASEIQGGHTIVGVGGTAVILPIVYHRATNTGTDVTLASARDRWATQRSRGAFGRPNVVPF